MSRLKDKVIKWLGLNDIIEENQRLAKQLDNMQHRVNNQSRLVDKINDVVKVGVDDRRMGRDRSWAVICIPGRQRDHVEFIDLTAIDHTQLTKFLRDFNKRNMTIDTPHRVLRDQLKRF